nr:MAG TPA: head tail connector [Caudoviricetes sp.]
MAKVSEITVQDIADYLRLSEPSKEDENFLEKCLEIAKSFIKNYTGVDDLDGKTEFVICVYVLCQSMYDDRVLIVEKDTLNPMIKAILDMHNRNLI